MEDSRPRSNNLKGKTPRDDPVLPASNEFYMEPVYDPVCCLTSGSCCQPYLEGGPILTDQATVLNNQRTLLERRLERRPDTDDLLITRRNRTVYRPADPGNNPYAELFKQGFNQETPKVDKLSSHDIMVSFLTGGMVTIALIAGVALMYVAHKRAKRGEISWSTGYCQHSLSVKNEIPLTLL
jgi:hypothetical protein